MIRLSLIAFALCWVVGVVAADDPKKDEDGPIAIDFSPVPNSDMGCRVKMMIKAADGTSTKPDYSLRGGTKASALAQMLKDTLPKGFEAELDGSKVIINNYKGHSITKVEIEVEGLPQGSKGPTAKRLPKPEKKDKEPEKK